MHNHARNFPIASLVAVSLLLGACAEQYVPPTTGELATIKLMGGNYAFLDTGNSCDTRKRVDYADREHYVNLPAGKRVFLEQGIDGRATTGLFCGVALSFEPQAGHKYVTRYLYQGDCQLTLMEVDPRGSTYPVPGVTQLEPRECLLSGR